MSKVLETNRFKDAQFINRFKRLIGQLDKRNEDILADPLKYFGEACNVINNKQLIINKLKDAAFVNFDIQLENQAPISCEPFDIVRVSREDYNCLVAVRQLINSQTI